VKKAILAATAALSAIALYAQAHHSISMIEISDPHWLSGTVVRFKAVDPHVMIELAERQSDGSTRRWILEGPRMARYERVLEQAGHSADQPIIHVGDTISLCGFPLTKQYDPAKMYDDWKPVNGRFLHAEVLTLPGGRMTAWGPYGKMDNCLRPKDTPQSWIEFLNRDALARQLWCTGKSYTTRVAAGAPKALIRQVDGALAQPCG